MLTGGLADQHFLTYTEYFHLIVFSGDIFTCCVVAILIFIKTGLLLNLKTWEKDKEHLAVQVQPTEGHIIQKD